VPVSFAVIRKQNTLVCQFASPLDVNMHDKPEVSLTLESFISDKKPSMFSLIMCPLQIVQ